MYCIIKCIVQGKQARVKNANLPSPVLNVLNNSGAKYLRQFGRLQE